MSVGGYDEDEIGVRVMRVPVGFRSMCVGEYGDVEVAVWFYARYSRRSFSSYAQNDLLYAR